VPGLETPDPLVGLPNVPKGPITLAFEKHPRADAHSHLLKPQSTQVMSLPLPGPGNSPSLISEPFRPFLSINDYIFADEHVRAHTSIKSIDRLLSTYPPGHLAFRNHKDLFQTVDQAARATSSVRCAVLIPF
jgi:hypothetical protein